MKEVRYICTVCGAVGRRFEVRGARPRSPFGPSCRACGGRLRKAYPSDLEGVPAAAWSVA